MGSPSQKGSRGVFFHPFLSPGGQQVKDTGTTLGATTASWSCKTCSGAKVFLLLRWGCSLQCQGAPRKRDKKKLAQVGNQPALAFCWLKAAPRADPAFAPRQKAKQPNCWQGGGSKLEASRGWAWRQWGCLAMGLLDPGRAHSSPGWFTSRSKPSPGFSSPNLANVYHPLDFHRV